MNTVQKGHEYRSGIIARETREKTRKEEGQGMFGKLGLRPALLSKSLFNFLVFFRVFRGQSFSPSVGP
jgi:hypothetical protein